MLEWKDDMIQIVNVIMKGLNEGMKAAKIVLMNIPMHVEMTGMRNMELERKIENMEEMKVMRIVNIEATKDGRRKVMNGIEERVILREQELNIPGLVTEKGMKMTAVILIGTGVEADTVSLGKLLA